MNHDLILQARHSLIYALLVYTYFFVNRIERSHAIMRTFLEFNAFLQSYDV
jgi:hypothetical protein